MKIRHKQEIEAMTSILSYATEKVIVDQEEISDAEKCLDRVLASLDRDKRFFKRLL